MKRVMMTVVLLMLAVGLLGGCEAERLTRAMPGDSVTAEGRWSVDNILYRSYNVTLRDAYNASRTFFTDKGWTMERTESGADFGRVEGTMAGGNPVRIVLLVDKSGATDVGLKVGRGDKFESADLLDQLEKYLPGNRINANLPPG